MENNASCSLPFCLIRSILWELFCKSAMWVTDTHANYVLSASRTSLTPAEKPVCVHLHIQFKHYLTPYNLFKNFAFEAVTTSAWFLHMTSLMEFSHMFIVISERESWFYLFLKHIRIKAFSLHICPLLRVASFSLKNYSHNTADFQFYSVRWR